MNGNSAILDSNILIYISKNELPLTFLDQFDSLFISVISYMEVLGYTFRDSEEETFVKEIMDLFNVALLTRKSLKSLLNIENNNVSNYQMPLLRQLLKLMDFV